MFEVIPWERGEFRRRSIGERLCRTRNKQRIWSGKRRRIRSTRLEGGASSWRHRWEGWISRGRLVPNRKPISWAALGRPSCRSWCIPGSMVGPGRGRPTSTPGCASDTRWRCSPANNHTSNQSVLTSRLQFLGLGIGLGLEYFYKDLPLYPIWCCVHMCKMLVCWLLQRLNRIYLPLCWHVLGKFHI